MIPTGSEDPYGLRRQAIGVLKMLQALIHDISLDIIIEKALQGVAGYTPSSGKSLTKEILLFFYQRLEGLLHGEGYSYDLVNSVLPAGEGSTEHNIKNICGRIRILSSMKQQNGFPELLTAAKRVCNILANVSHAEPDQKKFSDPSEKDLYRAVKDTGAALEDTEYQALFHLTKPINAFFENVLVMDKDDMIRKNRLALLSSVKKILERLGDFSQIVE
jgi:glycyl-tRNA synthetase beta chain